MIDRILRFFGVRINTSTTDVESIVRFWKEYDRLESKKFCLNYFTHTSYVLERINLDGTTVLRWYDQLERYPTFLVCKYFENVSARTRKIRAELETSDGYMELIGEFQKAVKELENR